MRRKLMESLAFPSILLALLLAPVRGASSHVPTQQVKITAQEMCCRGCVRKISGKLYTVRGVKSVTVDLSGRVLTITLPQPTVATLGQLWQAVEQGDGGPTKLVTSSATYSFTPAADAAIQSSKSLTSMQQITVEDLHTKGRAQKIAAQLYALQGVTQVSVDMKHDTLVVESRTDAPLSPWRITEAVIQAQERPLVVRSRYGTLSIEWSADHVLQNHHQAQRPTNGGIAG